MKKLLLLFIFIVISTTLFSQVDHSTKLLRFPNTSKNHITFTYSGDIYIVPISGGLATKLTSFHGIEQMSRFSPDGQSIAFIGNYDGNPEIYTMSINGSSPFRVTYSMDHPNLPDRQGPDKIIMQ